MSKNSKIEWTHHTFNPWWGCTKISPGCDFCYAESWALRVGSNVWGAQASRRFFSEAHWKEPLRWNADAEKEGGRRRVFCASMADVFENRPELDPWRARLWDLVARTSHLDWLLLTKRPTLVARYAPWQQDWPANVWLGTTVESQAWAEQRLPSLLEVPAAVRFLSCEPLLGPLDLRPYLHRIDWVIAGGESGAHARPMNPEWPRNLRNQCVEAGVAFHFKQWGHWHPANPSEFRRAVQLEDSSGHPIWMAPLGKAASGRNLDGREWDEYPEAVHRSENALSKQQGFLDFVRSD